MHIVSFLIHFFAGHFADHTLDDIIERIALQFTARHIRGRPRPPYWYPGWPLYVCDSRYNDRERCFVRIKNWSSCVPEEVRKRGDWMPIYPFERMVYPRRFPSPFVRGRGVPVPRGPGGIGDAIERAEGERTEGGGTGRKRARKGGATSANALSDTYGPGKGVYAGNPAHAPAPAQQALAAHHQHAMQAQAQAQQGTQQRAPTPAQYQYNAPNAPAGAAMLQDRSILQAAGVPVTSANASLEKLPAETCTLLDFFSRKTRDDSSEQPNSSTATARRTKCSGSLRRL
jgi:chromatin structure-remodeling complex subunit RSC1/2